MHNASVEGQNTCMIYCIILLIINIKCFKQKLIKVYEYNAYILPWEFNKYILVFQLIDFIDLK